MCKRDTEQPLNKVFDPQNTDRSRQMLYQYKNDRNVKQNSIDNELREKMLSQHNWAIKIYWIQLIWSGLKCSSVKKSFRLFPAGTVCLMVWRSIRSNRFKLISRVISSHAHLHFACTLPRPRLPPSPLDSLALSKHAAALSPEKKRWWCLQSKTRLFGGVRSIFVSLTRREIAAVSDEKVFV